MDEKNQKQLVAKYRPRYFNELVGQRVPINTLESMLNEGKINPTILVSGFYGVGKTSLVRVLARYINCQKGELGDVCGPDDKPCINCKSMDAGAPKDVHEINAADSRGIDDVRNLIEKASLAPSGSRRRIFILEEAHAFTNQAFSALLKPLEEPRPKSVWLMTTTDPQKIPATIRSRSLQIKLFPVNKEAIKKLLIKIVKKEDKVIGDEICDQIATLALGHVRNAVMMLEQVIHYIGNGNGCVDNIDLPSVLDQLGLLPPDVLVRNYLQHVLNGDYTAISILRKVDNLNYFLSLVVKFLKNIVFLLAETPGLDDVEIYKDFFYHTEFITNFGTEDLVLLLELFVDALERSKSYELDALELLDLITLKALEITKTFEKGCQQLTKNLPKSN